VTALFSAEVVINRVLTSLYKLWFSCMHVYWLGVGQVRWNFTLLQRLLARLLATVSLRLRHYH